MSEGKALQSLWVGAIAAMMDRKKLNDWEGTCSELLKAVTIGRPCWWWPKNGRAASALVRSSGWAFDMHGLAVQPPADARRTPGTRARIMLIQRIATDRDTSQRGGVLTTERDGSRQIATRLCGRCSTPVEREFVVPNWVWNAVVRRGQIEGGGEYLCEACFRRAVVVYVGAAQATIQALSDALAATRLSPLIDGDVS